MWRVIFLITYIGFCITSLQAQVGSPTLAPEQGMPFIKTYLPTDYQAHRQNWCMIQDHRGILYVGNTSGLLTFDGVNWRTYTTPNASVVRSLTIDEKGQIFFGVKGDFGYITSDTLGRLDLVSLKEKIPDSLQNFKDVWNINCDEKHLFVHSNKYLFRFSSAYLFSKTLPSEATETDFFYWTYSKRIISAFYQNEGKLYFHDMFDGFKKVIDGDVKTVAGSELIKDQQVTKIVPLSSEKSEELFLLTTNKNGLFLLENNEIRPFQVESALQEVLKKNVILDAAFLPNKTICLPTTQNGVLFLDLEGNVIFTIDKSDGLPSDAILHVYLDKQGGLWLGTGNGIVRVEWMSPFSQFANASGVEGSVYVVRRHRRDLFLGTSTGVFRANVGDGMNTIFGHIGEERKNCFDLVSVGNELLGALPGGGFTRIEPERLVKINRGILLRVLQSRFNTRLVFTGSASTDRDWLLMYKGKEGWELKKVVLPILADIRYLGEESPGVIWLGSRTQGYLRVEIPALKVSGSMPQDSILEATIEQIGADITVTGGRVRLFYVYDRLYFATNKGLKRFDPATKTLLPDTSLGPALADTTREINLMVEGENGEIWTKSNLSKNGFNKLVPTGDGGYNLEEIPIMNRVADKRLSNMYHDPEYPGTFWFGGSEELIKLNPLQSEAYKAPFSTLVRKVSAGEDSAIYNGNGYGTTAFESPRLSYQDNALRFEFAATSFELPEKTQYQFRLKGFEKNWSAWTSETQKDYTNLPEGNYAFQVRAKNVYDVLGSEAAFAFSISPPWYRTWWAYVIYGLCFVGGIWAMFRWRERRLKAQNKALEAIIADRTKELAEKNAQLRELDNMKSRFFTNISHELRTPISLILGPASYILSRFAPKLGKEVTKSMKLIERNGQSLLDLVEELLELSRLDAGKLIINETPTAFYPFCRQLYSAFESMAAFKEITYTFSFDLPEDLWINIDPSRIQKIVNNLLSNAFKFTPEGGAVKLEVLGSRFYDRSQQPRTKTLELKTLTMSVSDTGRGIPPEDLPLVFDRYFQTKKPEISTEGGTGVGLAFSRELALLMGGDLQVESEWGRGSVFTLSFPANEADAVPKGETLTEKSDLPDQDTFDATSSAIRPSGARSKILIVEDNPDMQEMVYALLSPQYDCVMANDGQIAWELLEQNHDSIHGISLILSDIMMPRLDGYGLLERVKSHEGWKNVPVIMLTARAAEADKLTALRMGVDDYLLKPFSAPELDVRVANLIANYEARKALPEAESPIGAIAFGEAPSAEAEWLQQVEGVALDTLEKGLTLSATYLADAVALSERQLLRRIKSLTGLSSNQYIQEVKLQKARHLLENKAYPTIAEVAYEAGFNTPNYFAKVFEKRFGKLPSLY